MSDTLQEYTFIFYKKADIPGWIPAIVPGNVESVKLKANELKIKNNWIDIDIHHKTNLIYRHDDEKVNMEKVNIEKVQKYLEMNHKWAGKCDKLYAQKKALKDTFSKDDWAYLIKVTPNIHAKIAYHKRMEQLKNGL